MPGPYSQVIVIGDLPSGRGGAWRKRFRRSLDRCDDMHLCRNRESAVVNHQATYASLTTNTRRQNFTEQRTLEGFPSPLSGTSVFLANQRTGLGGAHGAPGVRTSMMVFWGLFREFLST